MKPSAPIAQLLVSLNSQKKVSVQSTAANQIAREYFKIQLRGPTDSISGPVANPYMSVLSLAKTSAGGGFNSLVTPAHGGLGKHRTAQ